MFETPLTTVEVADIVGGRLEGDGAVELTGLAAVADAAPGLLTFAGDEKNLARLREAPAGAAIVPEGAAIETAMVLIRVENVQIAVARLLGAMAPGEDIPAPGIHPTAVVDADAEIGEHVAVGPHATVETAVAIGRGTVLCHGVYVGRGTTIGADCVLAPGAVVRRGCRIGARVRIGPNSVVGHDGFGYVFDGERHRKVPHAGTVVIEDDCELGACCCVDRAKWGATVIGAGAKLDNLVQVAHNVKVGPGALLAALAGVAGSAELGRYVVLGGHVGIRDNITVGDGTRIGACSCLAAAAGPGETLFGIPAKDARTKMRELSALGKLPALLKRVKRLEKALDAGGGSVAAGGDER